MSVDKTVVKNPPFVPPALDELGREIVSPVSLVAIADLRPMTLEERVRRYMRLPEFQEDLEAIRNSEIEEEVAELLDADENPISSYEDRAQELRDRIRVRKRKEDDDRIEAERQAEREERELFRKRMKELREEGEENVSATTLPSTES